MKVLHIITGLKQGGAESALFRLVTCKNEALQHIVISMMDMGVYGSRISGKGIPVFALNMPQGRLTMAGLIKLFRLLRRIKPDIVQTWMYHADFLGGLIARLAGFPVVWGIVNFNLSSNAASTSTRLAARLCSKVSGWLPKQIITCSEKGIESHKEFGYSTDKFVTVPLGYDLSEFYFYNRSRQEFNQTYNLGDDAIVLGCVARWDPQKDHKNLLTAFSLLCRDYSNVYCVLVGPRMDQTNESLVSMIDKTCSEPGKVILVGLAESIPAIMSAMDLHILASIGEAFPNAVAEAMACETPCIVTDVGDAAVIVGNIGWVIPPADPARLYEAMKMSMHALQNAQEWGQRKKDSRRRILENYSMQTMVDNYLSVWQTVCQKK